MKKQTGKKVIMILCAGITCSSMGYIVWEKDRKDMTPPVIRFDEDVITVTLDDKTDTYIHGVRAEDETDGDVSDSLVLEKVIKEKNSGRNQFLAYYVAFDHAGNSAEAEREVIISDYTPPHFSIDIPLEATADELDSLMNYVMAEDVIDGNLGDFICYEGLKEMEDSPLPGSYPITLSVTNSSGDTATLPVTVEITSDSASSYESSLQGEIVLNTYIVYIPQGGSFDYEDYLSYINDMGVYQVDMGPMVTTTDSNGKKITVTQAIADGKAGNWINISQVDFVTDADFEVPGNYTGTYRYTSERTGYNYETTIYIVVE